LEYGLGGFFIIQGTFTVGTIVAFGSYLASLYASLQGLTSAPMEFSTSLVSFECVFEVLDLSDELPEAENAVELNEAHCELIFEDDSFRYDTEESQALRQVKRYGSLDDVNAMLSLKIERKDLVEYPIGEDESKSQARRWR